MIANGNNIDNTVLAYTAGIIDGEGCITICVTNGNNGKTFPYAITEVVNTNYDLIVWLNSTFGGSVRTRDPGGICKLTHIWELSGRMCLEFLTAILPYLKLKSKQAEIVINFQQRRGEGHHIRMPSEILKDSINIKNIRVLNHTGKSE